MCTWFCHNKVICKWKIQKAYTKPLHIFVVCFLPYFFVECFIYILLYFVSCKVRKIKLAKLYLKSTWNLFDRRWLKPNTSLKVSHHKIRLHHHLKKVLSTFSIGWKCPKVEDLKYKWKIFISSCNTYHMACYFNLFHRTFEANYQNHIL